VVVYRVRQVQFYAAAAAAAGPSLRELVSAALTSS
jgi:hypothetical protein